MQVVYRLFYGVRACFRKVLNHRYPLTVPAGGHLLCFEESIPSYLSWLGGKHFRFLNVEHDFNDCIDWNFKKYGKLWTYNLNYFEFLNQDKIDIDEGLSFIWDFIKKSASANTSFESYPTSLRGLNWIKFLCKHKITNPNIDAFLYAQYLILLDNLEYHLMGNHLLENGFSLLFASYYFKDDKLFFRAKKILLQELEEQILPDGAHFELSPMYHQIILFRLLDCINLLRNNNWRGEGLLKQLRKKASSMLGWLDRICFLSGIMPRFNDSTIGVAPSKEALLSYSDRLGVEKIDISLKESGYRRFSNQNYEVAIDVGPIGPNYIPGHGHADMLNFELYVKGKPLVVDTGVSTYDLCTVRQYERSTSAHNTVTIDGLDQSEVWASFRVGRRAKLEILEESVSELRAKHNGYRTVGVTHERRFIFEPNKVIIEDSLSNKKYAIARFHLSQNGVTVLENNSVACDEVKINFENMNKIWIEPYHYACGFNKTREASCLNVAFSNYLKTVIEL